MTDDGFSLLEAIIAIVIAGVVFSSISVALVGSVRASVQARENQNATDLLNKQIEYVRSLDFAAATEIKSDLAGDTNLTSTGGDYYLATSAGAEKVVAADVGSIAHHQVQVSQQNTTYTVSTYITTVTDTTNAAANYRRVTVLVTWATSGKAHSKRSSSFFTDTRRGLPLPRYTMGTAATFKTNVGATLALPIKITNVGAPDAFNLTASTPPTGAWSWYYDNGDGIYTTADLALTDSDGDGNKDTGLLQVGGTITVFAVRVIGASEATTQTVTLTATSAAQPTATTAVQAFSDQVLVDPASCTCTLSTYYLHNSSAYSDTVYQLASGNNTNPMLLNKTAPASTRSTLYNYATDCFSRIAATDCSTLPQGRYTRIGGAYSSSDVTKVAAWYYPVASDTCLKGTASLTIWVRAADGSGGATTITAYVGKDQNNGGSFVVLGSGSATTTATTSGGWQPVTIGLPLNAAGADTSGACVGGYPISNNKYLALTVVASGSANVRLGYDTTAYNAQALMPVIYGG